jgi:hypothetical protein
VSFVPEAFVLRAGRILISFIVFASALTLATSAVVLSPG